MRWRNSLGTGGVVRPREILDLRGGDQQRNAVGESDGDRARDVFDGGAQASKSHDEQQNSGHDPHQREAADSEAGNDAGHDDDKSARGSADLGARTAQGRDEEAGDDSGVEAGLRRDAGSDGEGHGQRQRHQSHRETCDEIVRKLLGFVALQTLKGAGKPPVSQFQ